MEFEAKNKYQFGRKIFEFAKQCFHSSQLVASVQFKLSKLGEKMEEW